MHISAASLAPDWSVRKVTPSDNTERTARSGAVVETIFCQDHDVRSVMHTVCSDVIAELCMTLHCEAACGVDLFLVLCLTLWWHWFDLQQPVRAAAPLPTAGLAPAPPPPVHPPAPTRPSPGRQQREVPRPETSRESVPPPVVRWSEKSKLKVLYMERERERQTDRHTKWDRDRQEDTRRGGQRDREEGGVKET